MGLKTKKPLPANVFVPDNPPAFMQAAKVTKYDARRGCGLAIVKSTGRKVRLPWCALKDAVVLSPGDTIYVAVDSLDNGRAETIFVPGTRRCPGGRDAG